MYGGSEEATNEQFIDAIHNGDLNEVKDLLTKGADPDAKDCKGHAPLLLAAYHGNEEVTGALLAAGADPNITCPFGGTALMWAAGAGHKAVVETLLKVPNINVNAVTSFNGTALMAAARGGDNEVVELLLAAGADIHVRGERDWTALIYAASHEHKEVVDILLAAGADIYAQDIDGYTALAWAARWAVKRGNVEILQVMQRHLDALCPVIPEGKGLTKIPASFRNFEDMLKELVLEKDKLAPLPGENMVPCD